MVYKVRTKCAVCENSNLTTILDYGTVPLAGHFPAANELEKEELFPLEILLCERCLLVQTDSVIDADKLFRDYRYMSSIGLAGHFKSVAQYLKDKFNLTETSRVVEIGSNDGVLLEPLKALGINAIGFEPAVNISKIATDKGCWVVNDYFSEENAQKYLKAGSVDLMVSNNCFAHIDDIKSIVRGVKYALKPDGHFVIEVSYLPDVVSKLQYDNIYHEHIYYYSLLSLHWLFSSEFDMTIVDCEPISIHSGSIRVVVKNAREPEPENVKHSIVEEITKGMLDPTWYSHFGRRVTEHSRMVRNKISELKSQGAKIAGYGASGRANMLCNVANLNMTDIDYIVDESPERAGRFIAGKSIPIVGPHMLEANPPDYIVLFAWNFADMIKKKLEGRGFKYITFFPEYKVSE